MKYYLLTELERVRVLDIQNYNQVINYRAFMENKSYEMKKRTLCVVKHDADFGDILLSPFPLFSENTKDALDLFVWDTVYKEFDFLTYDRTQNHLYYLPFFWRISGAYSIHKKPNGLRVASVTLNSPIPEDIPIIYLDAGDSLLVIARLDLMESLLRKGVCSVKLYPVEWKTGGDLHE